MIVRSKACRLSNDNSLPGAWTLIRRSTRAIAAKPLSIAAAVAAQGDASARISTIVPSIGRARRTLFEGDVIKSQEPLDAIGDVAARKRRAADILDVVVEGERRGRGLANELLTPIGLANLVTVALFVLHDLDAAYRAVAIERHRVGDVFVLADDLVEDEERAVAGAPHFLLRLAHIDAGLFLDRLLLLIAEPHRCVGERRAGEQRLLRLLERQIYRCMSGHRDNQRGNRRFAQGDPPHHAPPQNWIPRASRTATR